MGLEGNGVNDTSSYLVNRSVYSAVDSEQLISKSTWPLKLSGFVFAGLLVVGRSASYGDVTWTPTFHPASPLQVITMTNSKPAPSTPVPKTNGNTDASAAVKRSAADEVVVFNAGDSGDGGGHDGNHS